VQARLRFLVLVRCGVGVGLSLLLLFVSVFRSFCFFVVPCTQLFGVSPIVALLYFISSLNKKRALHILKKLFMRTLILC
jgi:ABC-type Fe3+-siderophore transport system permease subunit